MWAERVLLALVHQIYIQFTLQLLISESIFLVHKSRRVYARWPFFLSLVLLFFAGWGWSRVTAYCLDPNRIEYAVVYIGFSALSFLWILWNYEMNPMEALFVAAGGYAVEHMSFTVTRIFLYAAAKYICFEDTSLLFLICTRFMIYGMIAYLVYILIVRKSEHKLEFREGDNRIAGLALVLMVCAVIMSQCYTKQEYEGSFLSQVICPLYGCICCCLVLILVYYVLWAKKMQWEKESMEQMLRISENQRKSSKEAINIINIKCHDLKHQIRALKQMDDEKERKAYINEIQQAVSIYDAEYHTKNEALDYVLREKALFSKEYGIKFSTMVDGRLLSFMSATDIYALMSNAIDNAFECVIEEEEAKRIVSLQVRAQGKMALIHLENWCTVSPEFQDGLPLTRKRDKSIHGFGVKSIRYVVEKYKGELTMAAHDQMFYLNIFLPLGSRF